MKIPVELKALVHEAVALLGGVIRDELGEAAYRRVERIRVQMAGLRDGDAKLKFRTLDQTYRLLEALTRSERLEVARAFSLMLEVMNACESAYRTYRLRRNTVPGASQRLEGIIFVLTAHPTEARSPENIAVFRALQEALTRALESGFEPSRQKVQALIHLAWKVAIVRSHRPTVLDEADHIYSILLRDEILELLLEAGETVAPVYVRSWVGGDKDGHPGVGHREMLGSLGISRGRLTDYAARQLDRAEERLALARGRSPDPALDRGFRGVRRELLAFRWLRAGDGARARHLRQSVRALEKRYRTWLGAPDPALLKLQQLFRVFPALVVPLELRESAEVLAEGAPGDRAIRAMLRALKDTARGGDPRWYARGMVVSMASSLADVKRAAACVRACLGALKLPVVPLFEQRDALERAGEIVADLLGDRTIREACRRYWGGSLEVMVGYSDSAKESGVLPSRVLIARALLAMEHEFPARGDVRPIFFHGSGGSVDRGGGSIQEQTAWWPRSALRLYKATIQGEMVERTFASAEIARGQIERIAESAAAGLSSKRVEPSAAVRRFAEEVRRVYSIRVASPHFLDIVERATPYRFLSALRIGSRPVRRKAAGETLSLEGLRAIPWVLCWTQTRLLFPSWWGVGAAWRNLPSSARSELRAAFRKDPLFSSFVKILGFSLAKVELPVFRMYLEKSSLSPERRAELLKEFEQELQDAAAMVRALSGKQDLLWFRPWLGESIHLRGAMIHPLNLLQILGLRSRDLTLIRVTVTGISSGMMTTG